MLNPCRHCCQKLGGGDCDAMILAAVQASFSGFWCLFLMFVFAFGLDYCFSF